MRRSLDPPALDAYGFKLKYGGEVTIRWMVFVSMCAKSRASAQRTVCTVLLNGSGQGCARHQRFAASNTSIEPGSLSFCGSGGVSIDSRIGSIGLVKINFRVA